MSAVRRPFGIVAWSILLGLIGWATLASVVVGLFRGVELGLALWLMAASYGASAAAASYLIWKRSPAAPKVFLVWGALLFATLAWTVSIAEPGMRLAFVPSTIGMCLLVWLGHRYLRKALA